MENILEKEMLELIEKHLPAATAGVLQTRLEAADQMEKTIERLTKDLEEKSTAVINLKALKIEKEDLDRQIQDIAHREKKLADDQNKLDLEKVRHELTCAKESKKDIFDLVNTFMKNPRSIEIMNGTVMGERHHTYSNGNGGTSGHSENIPVNVFHTTERKEEKD